MTSEELMAKIEGVRDVTLKFRIDSVKDEAQGPGHGSKDDGFMIVSRLAESELDLGSDVRCIFNHTWISKTFLESQGLDNLIPWLLDQARRELIQFPRDITAIEQRIEDATDVLRGVAFVEKRTNAG